MNDNLKTEMLIEHLLLQNAIEFGGIDDKTGEMLYCITDKLQEVKDRNYRGLVLQAIKSTPHVQWILVEAPEDSYSSQDQLNDWIDDIDSDLFTPQYKHETGVIAQEIQDVIPDAVVNAPFNTEYTRKYGVEMNYLTVDKQKIIPLLIEAIKEQQKQIDELKSIINSKP